MKSPRTSRWLRSRTVRRVSQLGTVASAVMLAVTTVQALPAGTPAASPGIAMTPTSGDKTTEFNLTGAGGAAMNCPGDTVSNGYRWRTFIASAGVDPAVLVFNNLTGPNLPTGSPTGATVEALRSTANSMVVNQNTVATTGQIAGIPAMNFANTTLADGVYKLGFACTQANPGQGGVGAGATANGNQKYFVTSITVSGGGTTWVADAVSTTTTTSATTTTTAGGTTTTAATTTTRAATTTTAAVTTTTAGATTTTAVVAGATVTPTTTPIVAADANLPRTGSSTGWMLLWAVLLLVFGRMAILAGREVKVIPVGS